MNLNYWQQLCSTALLGTDRQSLPPAEATALAPFLATSEARETDLLNAAALATLYRRSGQALSKSPYPPLSLAPDQPLPHDPDEALLIFNKISESGELWKEWLHLSNKHHLPPPPGTLYRLLKLGHNISPLRPHIARVIGAKGQWLAQFLPEASWLIPEELPEQLWEEGSLKERVAFLTKLRSENAEQARALVEEIWAQENAEARSSLLEAFWKELSLTDESFLESCLDDKSKRVRALAAEMLSSLPDSQLSQRMIERAKACMVIADKSTNILQRFSGIKGFSGTKATQIILPEDFDLSMARDGIQEKGMPYQTGEKQWWFQQIVARVPPANWPNLATLVQTVDKSWQNLLTHAFVEASLRYQDKEAFKQLQTLLSDDQFVRLLPIMSQEDKETYCLIFLQKNAKNLTYHGPFFSVLRSLSYPLGTALEQELIASMGRFSKTDKNPYDYPARLLLEHSMTLLSTTTREQLSQLAPKDNNHYLYEHFQKALSLLEWRARMHRYFGEA